MDKYKKITDLGLKVYPISRRYVVFAEDLLELLDAGVEVYGSVGNYGMTFSNHKPGTYIQENINHSALLINIKQLKPKQVTITRADFDKALKKARQGSYVDLNEIAKELGL